MTLRVPLRPAVPSQRVFVTLEGRRFRLDLEWLGRIQRWSISVYTGAGAGDPIVQGKGLVINANVLGQCRYRVDAPAGALILSDTQNQNEEATLASLGRRHALYFVPYG